MVCTGTCPWNAVSTWSAWPALCFLPLLTTALRLMESLSSTCSHVGLCISAQLSALICRRHLLIPIGSSRYNMPVINYQTSKFNTLPQMTLAQLAFVLSTLTVFVVYWMNGQRRNLPPGPRKHPFIGSLLSLPTTREWETFAKWGQEYSPWWIDTLTPRFYLMVYADSDIIHVKAFGRSIIILNSYEVATNILHRRSSNYSSR